MKMALWISGLILVGVLSFHFGKYSSDQKITEPEPLKEVAKQTGGVHSFAKVIASTCEVNALPFDKTNPIHQDLHQVITNAAAEVSLAMSQTGAAVRKNRRINEASKHFEDALQARIEANEAYSCTIPKTRQGKAQRSGYPDLRIEHLESGTVAYLDPKLFEEKSRTSSFRTFYFEPSKTHKVTEDAIHFLIGFPHDGKTRLWTFGKPELIDLFELNVKLKTEFSVSNRDLYGE